MLPLLSPLLTVLLAAVFGDLLTGETRRARGRISEQSLIKSARDGQLTPAAISPREGAYFSAKRFRDINPPREIRIATLWILNRLRAFWAALLRRSFW